MLTTLTSGLLAMAQAPGGTGSGTAGGAGFLTSQLPLILILIAIFYFMLIRPQQKQQKKIKEMLSSLKRGDEVLTRGGIIGRIHGIADNIVTIEVAENVKMKFSREAIAAVTSPGSQLTEK